ncbi:MAG: type II toxin-antitoxin system VapC family toxin [Acidobacteriota bacterium]|jgi:predicted nucleic acid-binding protein
MDGSIALSWFLPGERTDKNQAVRKLIEGGMKALVPSIWAQEVANALLVAERRKRISQADSAAAWASLQKLPIEADPETAMRAGSDILALARQQKLCAYDAAYLELAMRQGTPLASLDELLRAAARALRVPLVPEAL